MANSPSNDNEIPEAVVEAPKRGPRVSIVWLIPLLAALIGGWLAYKTLTEQGPLITISLKTAEGLEVGKTVVKFKDVDIGTVEAIDLKDDLRGVVVTVRMNQASEPYLNDKTRFWVVRAEVTAAGVTGLGTLLAGAYIGIDPVPGGKTKRAFIGLENPPVVTTGEPGTRFQLHSEAGSTLSAGSPVYYRRYKVGEVSEAKLSDDGQRVKIGIFVNAPYDELVREGTRFWNASGVDLKLSADGLEVNTESIVSVLIGGIAFDLPPGAPQSERAREDASFPLHPGQQAAFTETYAEKRRWVTHFDGSVRGLTVGAPVELRGIPVGRVVDFRVTYDEESNEMSIPVTLEVEPGRMDIYEGAMTADKRKARLDEWIGKGLRAQLKTGNLLTGQLLVELDFFPDAPPAEIDWSSDPPQFPTVPPTTQRLVENVTAIADRLAGIPFEDIGTGVAQAVKRLDATLTEAQALLTRVKGETVPAATSAIKQAKGTLATAEKAIAADSPLRQDLGQTLEDVAQAARSLKILLDYLEQHPDALLRGKGKGEN
ncbi:MAG: MlaD family protein [Sedimenticolaceae bacterium]